MKRRTLHRVLVVNLKSLPTWHLDLAAAFARLGCAATTFDTTPHTLAERMEKSLRGTKWFRSPHVLARLVAQARAERPDLIVFLGQFVLPVRVVEALEHGLDYRPLLTGWVCDCFRAPQFDDWCRADHVFYFDSFLESVLAAVYPDASVTTYLPLAADPERYRPLGIGARDPRLVFVGNVSGNRQAVLDALDGRVPLAVQGPNAAGRRLNRRRKLSAAAINRLYNTHAAVLNINQSPNTEFGLNLRCFEATAAGAVLLTQDARELPCHFEPGHELLAWDSPATIIEHYHAVRADPARAARIAAAGRARTCAEHTFVHRARTILDALA